MANQTQDSGKFHPCNIELTSEREREGDAKMDESRCVHGAEA